MSAAARPEDLRRPLAVVTALVWLMVTAPVLPHLHEPGRARLAVWAASSLAFLTTTLLALRARTTAGKKALLAVSAVSVAGVVLAACDGFEGALLVLVALQLGGLVSRREGAAWIGAQSILLGVAIGVHWNAKAAWLLAPPYVGFQALAFFLADVLASSAAARQALARANEELAIAHRAALEHERLAERVRIARDLHDAVGHGLTALGMHLEVAGKLAEPRAAEAIAVAQGLARGALDDVRSVVERLRDDERIDVASALRLLAAETLAPRVHVAAPDGVCRDDPDRALALLRCVQEIVTNARRHARAQNLWVDVEVDCDAVRVSARDDGPGADDVKPGNGLRGMRERVEGAGGHLEIDTRPGSGFAVHATLPARRA